MTRWPDLFVQPEQPFDADPLGECAQVLDSGARNLPDIAGDQIRISANLPGRPTMAGRLAAFFSQHPNEWVDGEVLAGICGRYAWRTRCSDIRRPPYSMTIINRQRRVGKATISEYRYVSSLSDTGLGGAA